MPPDFGLRVLGYGASYLDSLYADYRYADSHNRRRVARVDGMWCLCSVQGGDDSASATIYDLIICVLARLDRGGRCSAALARAGRRLRKLLSFERLKPKEAGASRGRTSVGRTRSWSLYSWLMNLVFRVVAAVTALYQALV